MRLLRSIPILAACFLAFSSSQLSAAPIDLNDGQHAVHLPDTPKRVVPPMMAMPTVCCPVCARPLASGRPWACARSRASRKSPGSSPT